MATNFETGHAKNVANFETLIACCRGFKEKYNPSNEELILDTLSIFYIDTKENVRRVKEAKARFDEIEGLRMTAFKPYKSLATKIIGALSVSGASSTVISDAETINRRMQGRRAPGGKTSLGENNKPADKISVSQQSYDLKIDHFEKLIELLSREPKYIPNEAPLKIASLKAYRAELQDLNTSVKNAYIPYSNAINVRNRDLYASEVGLVAKAQAIKKYVKSVYGAKAPEYKSVTKITFRRLVTIQ